MLKVRGLIEGLYEELSSVTAENEKNKKLIEELYMENARLKRELERMQVNDSAYAESAIAPPTSLVGRGAPVSQPISQPISTTKSSGSTEMIVKEISVECEEEVKNVRISSEEKKKVDRKEYQRQYRLKQKENK